MGQNPNKITMFSSKLQGYQNDGKQKRNALIRATKEAAEKAKKVDELRGSFRIDTILMGSTGIGKTYNVEKALEDAKIKAVKITGSQSFFHFAGLLMVEHYLFSRRKNKKPNEKLIILADDCDSFFKDKEGRNTLKSISSKEGSRVLQYNKAIPEHLLTELQLEILENYRYQNGAQGFEIDCNDMMFIITTNFALPSENRAKQVSDANPASDRANKLMDLAAIRRRFTCKDFMLDKPTNWGWLAEVTMNEGLIDDIFQGMSEFEITFRKEEILTWVWNNWDIMTEHNLDTIRDLALRMKSSKNYIDSWDADYLDPELERRKHQIS